MILQKIALRNWRGYRELHTFRFEEGFNLVVGRNEAGKSTLFEAMTRALFDRHNSASEEIKRIRPLGSSLSPEVELVFFANGQRYRVRKRFLDQPFAELYLDRGGEWELQHEGDQADRELRDILQGEVFGRATRPEHRGLAQALWYLQYEDPLPKEAWSDSIKKGLAGLVQHVAQSGDEFRIFDVIEKVYSADFTPTGRIATARSEFFKLEQEILKDEQQFEDLREQANQAESFRSDLDELTDRMSETQGRLDQAKNDLDELTKALEVADALEEQKKLKEEGIRVEDETLKRLLGDQKDIERRLSDIGKSRSALKESSDESARLNADARQEQIAAGRHRKKWKEEYEPAIQVFDADLTVLQALERLRRLLRDQERLQKSQSKVNSAKSKLESAKEELAKLHAPTEQDLNEFQSNLSDLRVIEAQLESSAIRVGFEFVHPDTKVEAQPESQRSPDSGDFLVTAPTTFTIDDIGMVHVRGGGASIEELNTKRAALYNEVNGVVQRYSTEGPQGISDLFQQRVDLEAKVALLQNRLDGLANEESEDLESELPSIRTGILEESKVADRATEEWKTWGGQTIRREIATSNTERTRLTELIEEEQRKEKKASDDHLELVAKTAECSNAMSGLSSRIASLEEENTEALKVYSTTDHLKTLVSESNTRLCDAKAELSSVMEGYQAGVERPRRLHRLGEESIKTMEGQSRKISNDIVDRRAKIEVIAAQGLYSKTADLEGALQVKNRRREILKRRTAGAKLLYEMVAAFRQQQSAALAEPVAALVNNWLPLLTEDAYDELDLSEELFPIGVQSRRYDLPLPLESLSYGTYEQVIVLVRLALGCLLSNEERHLVIIDDRLVNADAGRMKRLCLILEEVASKYCQVVVATCDDTRYSGISENVIRVPFDGKPS